MTQEDYNSAKAQGKVIAQEAPASVPDAAKDTHDPSYTLDDFLPILVAMLPPIRHLTAAPTYVPKNFLECLAFVDDSTARTFYLYINGSWRSIPIGSVSTTGRSHSGGQAITPAFNTKITFGTNDYADGITWDGINHRFTATSAGKYLVTSSLLWAVTTDYQYTTMIYKNGAEVSRGATIVGSYSGNASSNVCDLVTLDVGDYVEIFALQYSLGDVNILGGSALSYIAIKN
jgi:hypothetical protein